MDPVYNLYFSIIKIPKKQGLIELFFGLYTVRVVKSRLFVFLSWKVGRKIKPRNPGKKRKP